MVITDIDLAKLNEVQLSIRGLVLCYCIMQNRSDILLGSIQVGGPYTQQELNKLQENGWIEKINIESGKICFENLQITEKFRIFVDNHTQQVRLSKDWIDDWFDLFPKGIKSGNYYVKSDLPGCKKKMRKFIAKHPEYTPEEIVKATTNYVESCSRKGYQYMKIAPYFIEKDGVSMLAGECEALKDNAAGYTNSFVEEI